MSFLSAGLSYSYLPQETIVGINHYKTKKNNPKNINIEYLFIHYITLKIAKIQEHSPKDSWNQDGISTKSMNLPTGIPGKPGIFATLIA